MSKRDMRAKRLLLAVLLAMSVQSYHAVPTWAEESGQTVKQAVKVDGEENAGTITVPADSESEAAAATDVDQEESAAAAAPAVTYSSRTAGSGTDDYGVMPLADQAINGALTGVTAINGITIDSSRNIANAGTYNGATISSTSFNGMPIGDGKISNMRIRDNAILDVKVINGVRFELDSSTSSGSIFIGKNVMGELTQKASIAIGSMAYALEDYSIAFGGSAGAEAKYGIAIGLAANVQHENSIAIGYNSTTNAVNQVSFGKSGAYRSLAGISDIDMNGALTGVTTINTANFQVVTGSLAIGQSSETVNASKYSLAIGNTALVIGGESNIAVGHSAKVDGGSLNIVVGSDAKVTGGGNNIVVGFMSEVTQDKNSSIAIGDRATAGGSSGVAIGSGSKVNDSEAIAIGSDTEAGYASLAVGSGAKAISDVGAIALGNYAKAGGVYSIALGGDAEALTDDSVAIGHGSKTNAANQVSFGAVGTPSTYRSLAGIKNIDMSGTVTAASVTDGTATLTGGKLSGLTDATLSTSSTDAVTGKQLNATNTTVSALDTAYQAADTTLQNNIDTKVAQSAYDSKMSVLDSADTALQGRATDLETKTAKFNTAGDTLTGMTNITSASATLGGVGFATGGVMTGVASIDGIAIDSTNQNITNAGTYNGVTVAAAGISGTSVFNGAAITSSSFNGVAIGSGKVDGVDVSALKTTVDGISADGVGTADTAGIKRDTASATTTIETNTKISSSGITTNVITASGTVTAGEFVEGSQKLSDKYAAKTALADYTTTTDMNTKFADYATTAAVDTKLADYAKSDSVYSKAAADTAFAKAGDVDTLKTTVGNASGGLVKDVLSLQDSKANKATTLAGYGIADAYTKSETAAEITAATKDMATSATVTGIQSGLDAVNTKTTGLSYDTVSGSSKFSGSVVVGNVGSKTHTQITDAAIIFGEGADRQVTVDASGIHVGKKAAGGIALFAGDAGTHIDHTRLVTGSVTADNLNGVAISGNATDGLSVGGVNIKDLQDRVTTIENSGGGTGSGTADTEGIKRTDVADGSGKTTVEGATSFTKDGLKTANLEAATAALGGVDFAGSGALAGVSSINGISFADGKIGGVSLSGGKVNGADITSTSFNGVDVKALKNKVDNLTPGGGGGGTGGGDNTSGIGKPDGDTTTIEGNTTVTGDGIETNKVTASDTIVVADGETNKTVISKDGITVAEGEKNQVKINEDGIHVGKNSSVINDTDGFITDKGLYIGVSSSSDTSTAKFSVAPDGNLSSKAGSYGFSNTSAGGAQFTHTGDKAYGTGSQLDTTIQGNKVTTGSVTTDELWVGGNKVTVSGGTVDKNDAIDNQLTANKDGYDYTNGFTTTETQGTTQTSSKTSDDGKESIKTSNNTSAGGTSVTTTKTTTDSKDNVTVKESSFGTNEKGLTLSTGTKVTDKDGKVTKNTSGETKMTGDSISVSKTTTTTEKDADGNEKEVTKTSGTTIGSGEVTLKREEAVR